MQEKAAMSGFNAGYYAGYDLRVGLGLLLDTAQALESAVLNNEADDEIESALREMECHSENVSRALARYFRSKELQHGSSTPDGWTTRGDGSAS